jgi:hypothetical protein
MAASAQLETRSQPLTNTAPNSVVAADFNHDGKIDIAVAAYGGTPGIQIFLGNGDGTFRRPAAYDVGSGTGPIASADLNHDGNLDLIVVNNENDSVAVLLGNGDGTFQSPANYKASANPVALVIEDFNGDGNADIAQSTTGTRGTTAPASAFCLAMVMALFRSPRW